MSIITINSIIKFLGIDFCIGFSFLKFTNLSNSNRKYTISIIISSIFLAIFQSVLQLFTPLGFRIFVIYFTYALILCKLTTTPLWNTTVKLIISTALSYISFSISVLIIALIMKFALFNIPTNDTLALIISAILSNVFIYCFFKIKRFKKGIPFINSSNSNDYLDIFVLSVNIIIIFMYFLFTEVYRLTLIYFMVGLSLFAFILLLIIQKSFILYQKQKLQTKTLKEYEHELQETKQKLSTAISEKANLVKSNHEFYHRQKAIERKLDLLLLKTTNNSNVEFGEDYGDILERLKQLSKEYNAKTQIIPKLPKTNITEIDDMLSYMQSECLANNIEFILKIECDINYLLDKFINKNDLETLLGDLIRNAIIAINHSNNDFRSIMVIFGIKDDIYELCILDSGIPFEINTLVNLGLAPASTHLDEGGTGIGFITTFETLNKYSASIIINELLDNNYSKSIEIKFDKSLNYTVISNRIDEIEKCNNEKRKIILKSDTAKC